MGTGRISNGIICIIGAILAWMVWSYFETRCFWKYDGKMKRGMKVWSEPLPPNVVRFLRRFPGESIDGKEGAFIRKHEDVVLVQHYPTETWWWRWGNRGCPTYVGYIDLREKEPKLEYRAPVSGLLFVALWMGMAILISLYDVRAILMVLVAVLVLGGTWVEQKTRMMKQFEEAIQAYPS